MAEEKIQPPPPVVTVNFGDGSPQQPAQLGVAVPHRYARAGRYGVSAQEANWEGRVDVGDDAPGIYDIIVEPPVATPAVTAHAGNPGYFTPDGSARPATGAAIATLPASPREHWKQPDYVYAANGDERWWDGERWRIGRATAPVPAVGANAGFPGVFTPPGCVTPVNGNAITPLIALPLTHWEPGEYVQARNGVRAYWDGRFWMRGAAPVPPVKATGATAGTPGFFTPAGAVTPNFGYEIDELVATPQDLWFAGQYVASRDNSERYWDGTTWRPGRSPALPIPATGATMGRPGFFTPNGAVTPLTGADIGPLLASPQTPWSPETWVQAANAEERYWDGTSWQPGKAPGFVLIPPIASFFFLVDELDVTFNASGSRDPDGTIVSYAWDLGDGDTSTEEFYVHTYPSVGTFDVTLTVTDNDGLTDTMTGQVTTLPPASQLPIALFSYVQAGAAVHFDGSTSYDPDGSIVSYAWEYGDGNVGTGVTGNHTYPAVGTFTAVLRVTDNDGDVGATSRDIVIASINDWPTAAYTWTADGVVVEFDGSDSFDVDGTITFWHWYFGDGTPMGDGETITHTYPAAGTYTCTLVVHDDENGWGQQQQTLVLTRLNQPPLAAFTWVDTNLLVVFDGRSSSDPDGTIAAYAWDFAGEGTSTIAQPQHTFSAAGDYNVELTVTDNQGATGTTNRIVSVDVAREGPTARFVMDPVLDLTVTFDGSTSSDTTGTIDVWAWEFGDGTTAAGVSTTHTYQAGQAYAATLTVTDENDDSHSTTRDVNFGPTARFVATVDDLDVNLDGSSSTDRDGTITTWEWVIDGGPESGETILVTLPAGDHQVQLTVTDNEGLTHSVIQTVTTEDPAGPPNERPTASFTFVTDSLGATFDATASTDPEGPVAGYAWAFGDAGVGTGANPVHNYDTSGTYTATLIVTDLQGLASLPASREVTVFELAKVPPIASFEYTVTGPVVELDGRSSNDPDGFITAWVWDFGDTRDRLPGEGDQTSHRYTTVGEKIVYLVVTDNDGLQSTQSRIVDIVLLNQPPVIDFDWIQRTGLDVDFTVTGGDPDGTIVSYAWDFGEGDPVEMTAFNTIRHTFAAIGSYTVQCQAVDNEGAPSNMVIKVVTLIGAPIPPVSVPKWVTYGPLVEFDGSDSYDLDGTIVEYRWFFGDGGYDTGITQSHRYTQTGNHYATLRTTDNDGLEHEAGFTVYVNSMTVPPILTFWWDVPTTEQPGFGTLVHFHNEISMESPDTNRDPVYWDFGDGGPVERVFNGVGRVDHLYEITPGTYRVQVQCTGAYGTSNNTVKDITVPDPPLAPLVAAPTYEAYGQVAVLDGRDSTTDPSATITQHLWSYSGTSVTTIGAVVEHTYGGNINGPHSATLRVTDSRGLIDTLQIPVVITEAGAGPYIDGFTWAAQGARRVTFTAGATLTGIAGSYLWDFGDGGAPQSFPTTAAEHTYATAGTYVVKMQGVNLQGVPSPPQANTVTAT